MAAGGLEVHGTISKLDTRTRAEKDATLETFQRWGKNPEMVGGRGFEPPTSWSQTKNLRPSPSALVESKNASLDYPPAWHVR